MNIVLVDDHPLVIKGLSSVLSLDKDINLIGEASNVNDAIELINKAKPDMALIDLRLGNEYGLDIIRNSNKSISCKFIVLTSSTNEDDFIKSEEAGAWGYISKEALPDELLIAVKLVSKGRKYYDSSIMQHVMKGPLYRSDMSEELTAREIDVLKALGQGLSNKNIAKKLFITEFTVKKYVSQILEKLQLEDRTQAALYACSKGLVKLN